MHYADIATKPSFSFISVLSAEAFPNVGWGLLLLSTPSQKNMIFPQSSSHRSKKIRLCEHMSQKKFQVSSWSRTILNGSSKFWEFRVVVGFSRF